MYNENLNMGWEGGHSEAEFNDMVNEDQQMVDEENHFANQAEYFMGWSDNIIIDDYDYHGDPGTGNHTEPPVSRGDEDNPVVFPLFTAKDNLDDDVKDVMNMYINSVLPY